MSIKFQNKLRCFVVPIRIEALLLLLLLFCLLAIVNISLHLPETFETVPLLVLGESLFKICLFVSSYRYGNHKTMHVEVTVVI